MRLAIVNLTGGKMSGGYRKYLRNVLPRISRHKAIESILCASPESIGVKDWFKPLPKVRFVNCKPFRVLFRNRDIKLLRELEIFSPDVIFVPVERVFRFKNVPVVNMIQNMEPFVSIFKNPLLEIPGLFSRFWHGQGAIKKSARIISPSNYVKEFLMKNWKIPRENIGLAYHGINIVENVAARRPEIIPPSWQDNFLFMAGSIRPARGIEDALRAVKQLKSGGVKNINLVIAGETAPSLVGYLRKLKNFIRESNLAPAICWVGHLSEEEMAWCYKNCLIFLMTSRVESFGMIGGEALAHGCVCISADSPCLPEIFADAAVFYRSQDPQALAEAIKRALLFDGHQRKIMSEKARKRAGKFSWDVCADNTVAELTKAAGCLRLNKREAP
ncbi:MAG: glycosyltransferase family 4 protein [Elusimicrobia bacterium]|nr:glycosyltransferase family 4 protein [Elusimicrobiota bacterium]